MSNGAGFDRRPGNEWRRWARRLEVATTIIGRLWQGYVVWMALVMLWVVAIHLFGTKWIPSTFLWPVALIIALGVLSGVATWLADRRDGQHQGGESK